MPLFFTKNELDIYLLAKVNNPLRKETERCDNIPFKIYLRNMLYRLLIIFRIITIILIYNPCFLYCSLLRLLGLLLCGYEENMHYLFQHVVIIHMLYYLRTHSPVKLIPKQPPTHTTTHIHTLAYVCLCVM